MYTTCMYCNKSLQTNEVVEEFPVGRRLAFDPARGRLWVVCRRCERWNLTPLDERWEAVETCEKLVRGTRIRTSTENIGLARHPEGLELVRIGKPLRPEFAAWRYGDQFGRRRRRAMALGTGAFLAGAGGMALGGALGGLGGIGFGTFIYQSINAWDTFRPSVISSCPPELTRSSTGTAETGNTRLVPDPLAPDASRSVGSAPHRGGCIS